MKGAGDTEPRRQGEVDPLRVAAVLARELDADDFESVTTMLHGEVEYRIGNDVHRGPDAVVASYRSGSALARRLFDHVAYSHQIVGLLRERTVRIEYADRLSVNGEHFEHHSVQDVEVDRDGLIVAITDQPVAGQEERLTEFMARHGLTRDEPHPG